MSSDGRSSDNLGWNAGATSIREVLGNLKPTVESLGWTFFGAVACTVVLGLATTYAASFIASKIVANPNTDFGRGVILMSGMGAGFVVRISTQLALVGTGRRIVLKKESLDGFVGIVADAFKRFGRSFLAVCQVGLVQALFFFLPGVIVVAMAPYMYLVCTRPGYDHSEASWRGKGWVKRHVLTLAGSAVIFVLVAVGLGLAVSYAGATITGVGTVEFGRATHGYPFWVMMVPDFLTKLLYFTGGAVVLYTMDAAENDMSVA